MTRKNDFHATALARINSAYSAGESVRALCNVATRFCFVPGAQYEGHTVAGSPYENMMKPYAKFEINKVRGEVVRIVNEYKNSRISAKFRPAATDSSEELAAKLSGKLQADAEDSNGTEARHNAFTEMTAGGFGAFCLSTTAESDEDIEGPRRITFDPTYDAPRSVWFDTNARQLDKSDAEWSAKLYSMTPDKFRTEYKLEPASLDMPADNGFIWSTPDVVHVAKYYERKLEETTLLTYTNPLTGHQSVYDETQMESVKDELEAIGYKLESKRKARRYNIYVSVVDGERTLVEPVRIPGSYIPIIPVYANRVFINDEEIITGHVQPSMDSQRLYNLTVSLIADAASYGNRKIPVLNAAEVAGHEEGWANARRDGAAFVTLDVPIGTQNANDYKPSILGMLAPDDVNPAVTDLINISNADISQTNASAHATQEIPGNIASETVSSFMGRADMQSYGYLSAMALAERHAARVWLSMAREVYGSEREIRIKLPDGSDEITTLAIQITDRETGEVVGINNLATGRYDVAIDVGPSFTTQRQATVAMLIELIKTTPEASQYYAVLYAMLIQNVYVPGMEPLKEFNNKQMLLAGIVPPKSAEEAQELQQYQQQQAEAAQNSPEAKILQAQAIEAQAKARSSIADTIDSIAGVFDTITDAWLKEAQAYHYVKDADAIEVQSALDALSLFTDGANAEADRQLKYSLGVNRNANNQQSSQQA